MTLRSLWIWLRYGRRQIYPWTTLAIAGWQWVVLCGLERDRAAIRWMATLVKIDGAKLTAFLNDLLW
ncbi:hypothetical protein IQ265_04810 [Nodosilinea sp. LEGE 06152]|uniref:hypothetical protein n=1 Tax=Nodosilinea sp. LEGE 06152 TaxID=2777966 RepID=UPI001882ECBA|nr:hypothetical protein [Nodosilinea sp. LEGE 06152]MBE9156155.1 hypothetical protein [Nodosilinea sp. LEGE 06152]